MPLTSWGSRCRPESTLIKFIGPPLQDSFAEFCGFSAERAAEAIAAFRERYEPVGKFENMAAPGMADLCARLKARGYVLALASSKPESLVCAHLREVRLHAVSSCCDGQPAVGDWSKADVIRETMRRLELTEAHKPEILMVGDRKFDVLGAKACGIALRGRGVLRATPPPASWPESGAVAVVRTPEELEQFILTH